MRISRLLAIFSILVFSPLVSSQNATAPTPKNSPWLTLTGNAPLVIAKGGFSGLLPDSSLNAYSVALVTSLPDVVLWCDVQLTKDGIGICAPSLTLDNCSSISGIYPNGSKSYVVNGVPLEGYFSIDFTLKDLSNVNLVQGIYSRSPRFDNVVNTINTVEALAKQIKPPAFWLHIQYDQFFRQHNLSMRRFVISVSRRVIIDYISSPEVDFLRSIATRFRTSKTKLIFSCLGEDDNEPSSNQTYGSLLRNLTFIKTFASGILVPKNYIWHPDSSQYLSPHSSVVSDAHKRGLEVYASDFANDGVISYNFSYDPLAESLSFINNGNFSVDGMVTSFPITQSEAVGCFSNFNKNSSQSAPVIISYWGASGIFPGSTKLSYQQAVDDGADIIDCSVQMTKDGMAVCLNSINLVDGTTVLESSFSSLSSSIPQILGGASGIFTFNLTWSDIQSLKPSIATPYLKDSGLRRNPAYANAGKFMTLAEFLAFAKDKPISGVLINIENAAFLAEKLGLSVTDSVIDALKKAGYDNQTQLGVTIQSTNTSVLNKFKQLTKYKRMYWLDESISDALNSSISDIKSSADSVAIGKDSIFPMSRLYTLRSTDVVTKLHSSGLKVYAYLFRNEYLSQAWDFFSDPTVEINSFVQGAGVDGIITEYPGTASRYRKSPCLAMGDNVPNFMKPAPPGGLLQLMASSSLPPAMAPYPVLKDADVEEPPLPPVSAIAPGTTNRNASTPIPAPSNAEPCRAAACIILSLSLLLGLFLN